jgi:hypothetical protein
METKEFCHTMITEFAGWRDRLYGVISHVETLPALDRQYFSSDVNVLRALISEIEDNIRALKLECQRDFSTAAKAA